jgi:hypothetical protein
VTPGLHRQPSFVASDNPYQHISFALERGAIVSLTIHEKDSGLLHGEPGNNRR